MAQGQMHSAVRDYAVEMRALIDKETSEKGGPYSSRAAAERIVEYLRAADPDLLDGWLRSQAAHFVWQAINTRDRSMRSRARATSRSNQFSSDAEAFSKGDPKRLVRWLDVPFVVSNGLRMRLAEMHQKDLEFVAGVYQLRAEDNRMTAAFLTVIARKVGNRAVGEVYTDARLSAAWNAITGNNR